MLSIVVPVYNEEKNLPLLFSRLFEVLSQLAFTHEIIVVDDGSTDGSYEVARALAMKDDHFIVIQLATNFGQTAALSAGIEHATGDVIVSIDSDLENDPADIPRLLAKLDEGYDVVSGWRHNRWKGAFFTRRLPSLMANWLISRLTGLYLHDYGCTLKAYRADVIKSVKLYGEMHRFITAYVSWQGGKVAEIKVNHQSRIHGKSKYGFGRIFRVLPDLLVIVFMHRYMNRPMHFFGAYGFFSVFLGVCAGLAALLLRIFGVVHIVETPLPIFSVLLILVGVQMLLFGVIAEILMRTYYESQNKRPYVIADVERV